MWSKSSKPSESIVSSSSSRKPHHASSSSSKRATSPSASTGDMRSSRTENGKREAERERERRRDRSRSRERRRSKTYESGLGHDRDDDRVVKRSSTDPRPSSHHHHHHSSSESGRRDRDDEDGRRSSAHGEKKRTRASTRSITEDSPRAGESSNPVGAQAFTQFPGQYDAALPGMPSPAPPISSHVQDQFPGQFPTQSTEPYRPPLSVAEGGPGAAAEYYGDQGQSVLNQPGVRPNEPTVIMGTEPHLQTPSAVSAPPVEPSVAGGVGAAASFFTDPALDSYESSSKPSIPGKTSKPSKTGKPSKISGSAIATGGAALAYTAAMASGNSHHTSSHQEGSNIPASSSAGYMQPSASATYHSSSAPAVPTVGGTAYGSAAGIIGGQHGLSTSKPVEGSHQSSHPNAGLYAAGALGAAALAAHQHHHHPSEHYSVAGSPHPGNLSYKQRRRGPMSKFADFWRDPDGVAQFEEYTEYMGVCKYCFAPGSSPRDAPRVHHYRSGSGRKDKDRRRRYSSDSSGSKRKNSKSWMTAGLAGYGLTKVGKTLFKKDSFDDLYSARSGRYSTTSLHGSVDGKSYTSRGAVRRRSRSNSRHRSEEMSIRRSHEKHRSRSRDRTETGVTKDGRLYKKDSKSGSTTYLEENRRRRSKSRDRDGRLVAALAGTAIGVSAPHSHKSHRSRSNSPRGEFVRRKARRSRESSPDYKSRTFPGKGKQRRRSPEAGILGGLFGGSPETSRKGKSRKDSARGIVLSSQQSTTDLDLAFGAGSEERRSKRKTKTSSSRRSDAAMLASSAAALTIVANQVMSDKDGKRKPEIVAVRESKKSRHGGRDGSRRKSHSSASSSDSADGGWESATDDDASSTGHTDLAFGSFYDQRTSMGRGSRESVVSDASSGTGKWGWRWGNRGSRSKKAIGSTTPPGYPSTSASAAVLGLGAAAAGAAMSDQRDRRDDYASSSFSGNLPPLQQVYPVPTSDPNSYDVRRQGSLPYQAEPILTSRPAPVPIQQPQPYTPVTSAVYSTQAPIDPTYSVTVGPTVPSYVATQPTRDQSQRLVESPSSYPPADPFAYQVRDDAWNIDDAGRQRADASRRRRDSSPTRDASAVISRKESKRRATLQDGESSGRFKETDKEQRKRDRDSRKSSESTKPESNEPRKGKKLCEADERAALEKLRGSRSASKKQEASPPRRSERSERDDDREFGVSWKEPVAAATVGAAVGVFAASSRDSKSETRRSERRKETEEPAYGAIYDVARDDQEAAHSRHEADRQTDIAREAAAKVVTGASGGTPSVLDKYTGEQQSQADFFMPDELRHSSKEQARSTVPVFDDNVVAFDMPEIIEVAPPDDVYGSSYPGFNSTAAEGGFGAGLMSLPWEVPRLNLISPTPTPSVAGNRSGGSSPLIAATDSPTAVEDLSREADGTSKSGRDVSPKVIDSKSEVGSEVPRSDEQEASPSSTRGRNAEQTSTVVPRKHMPGDFEDDIDFAATLAAGLEDTGFDPSIVIDDPSYRRRDSPPGTEDANAYRKPFAETVSDLGSHVPGVSETVSQTSRRREVDESAVADSPKSSSKRDKKKKKKSKSKASDDFDRRESEGEQFEEAPEAPTSSVTQVFASEPSSLAGATAKSEDQQPKRSKSGGKRSGFADVAAILAAATPKSDDDLKDLATAEDQAATDLGCEKPSKEESRSKTSKRESTASDPPADENERESIDAITVDEARDIEAGAWDGNEVLSKTSSKSKSKAKSKSKSKSKRNTQDFEDDEIPTASVTASEVGQDEWSTPKKSKTKLSRKDSGKRKSTDVESLLDDRKERKSKSKRLEHDDDDVDDRDEASRDREAPTAPDDDDDAAVSVALSSPTTNDVEESKKTGKSKKKGAFFGLFSRSTDSPAEPAEAKASAEADTDPFEQPMKKGKKSKNRRSTAELSDLPGADDRSTEKGLEAAEDPSEDRSVAKEDRQTRKKREKEEKRRSRREDEADSGRVTQHQDNKDLSLADIREHSRPAGRGDPTASGDPDDHNNRTIDPEHRENDRPSMSQPPSAPSGTSKSISVEDSADALSRLEGRAPEGRDRFPVRSPETSRSAINTTLAGSPTAVPLHFKKPKSTAGITRSASVTGASTPTLSSPASPTRPRHGRPLSTEFRKSKEYRPLYLVERHASKQEVEQLEERYPSLPSSRATSRSASQHKSEDDQAAGEPHDERPVFSEAIFGESADASGRESDRQPEQYKPGLDLLDSAQSTPRAMSLAQQSGHAHERSETRQLPSLDTTSFREIATAQRHAPASPTSSLPRSPTRFVHSARDLFPIHGPVSPLSQGALNLEDLPALPPSRPDSPTLLDMPIAVSSTESRAAKTDSRSQENYDLDDFKPAGSKSKKDKKDKKGKKKGKAVVSIREESAAREIDETPSAMAPENLSRHEEAESSAPGDETTDELKRQKVDLEPSANSLEEIVEPAVDDSWASAKKSKKSKKDKKKQKAVAWTEEAPEAIVSDPPLSQPAIADPDTSDRALSTSAAEVEAPASVEPVSDVPASKVEEESADPPADDFWTAGSKKSKKGKKDKKGRKSTASATPEEVEPEKSASSFIATEPAFAADEHQEAIPEPTSRDVNVEQPAPILAQEADTPAEEDFAFTTKKSKKGKKGKKSKSMATPEEGIADVVPPAPIPEASDPIIAEVQPLRSLADDTSDPVIVQEEPLESLTDDAPKSLTTGQSAPSVEAEPTPVANEVETPVEEFTSFSTKKSKNKKGKKSKSMITPEEEIAEVVPPAPLLEASHPVIVQEEPLEVLADDKQKALTTAESAPLLEAEPTSGSNEAEVPVDEFTPFSMKKSKNKKGKKARHSTILDDVQPEMPPPTTADVPADVPSLVDETQQSIVEPAAKEVPVEELAFGTQGSALDVNESVETQPSTVEPAAKDLPVEEQAFGHQESALDVDEIAVDDFTPFSTKKSKKDKKGRKSKSIVEPDEAHPWSEQEATEVVLLLPESENVLEDLWKQTKAPLEAERAASKAEVEDDEWASPRTSKKDKRGKKSKSIGFVELDEPHPKSERVSEREAFEEVQVLPECENVLEDLWKQTKAPLEAERAASRAEDDEWASPRKSRKDKMGKKPQPVDFVGLDKPHPKSERASEREAFEEVTLLPESENVVEDLWKQTKAPLEAERAASKAEDDEWASSRKSRKDKKGKKSKRNTLDEAIVTPDPEPSNYGRYENTPDELVDLELKPELVDREARENAQMLSELVDSDDANAMAPAEEVISRQPEEDESLPSKKSKKDKKGKKSKRTSLLASDITPEPESSETRGLSQEFGDLGRPEMAPAPLGFGSERAPMDPSSADRLDYGADHAGGQATTQPGEAANEPDEDTWTPTKKSKKDKKGKKSKYTPLSESPEPQSSAREPASSETRSDAPPASFPDDPVPQGFDNNKNARGPVSEQNHAQEEVTWPTPSSKKSKKDRREDKSSNLEVASDRAVGLADSTPSSFGGVLGPAAATAALSTIRESSGEARDSDRPSTLEAASGKNTSVQSSDLQRSYDPVNTASTYEAAPAMVEVPSGSRSIFGPAEDTPQSTLPWDSGADHSLSFANQLDPSAGQSLDRSRSPSSGIHRSKRASHRPSHLPPSEESKEPSKSIPAWGSAQGTSNPMSVAERAKKFEDAGRDVSGFQQRSLSPRTSDGRRGEFRDSAVMVTDNQSPGGMDLDQSRDGYRSQLDRRSGDYEPLPEIQEEQQGHHSSPYGFRQLPEETRRGEAASQWQPSEQGPVTWPPTEGEPPHSLRAQSSSLSQPRLGNEALPSPPESPTHRPVDLILGDNNGDNNHPQLPPSSSNFDLNGRDRAIGRAAGMADVYEGIGSHPGSPRSPTRPPSMRHRQSMQIMNLEGKLEQLAADNRKLEEAKAEVEKAHYDAVYNHTATNEVLATRDQQLREHQSEIEQLKQLCERLQNEMGRLREMNEGLEAAGAGLASSHAQRYGLLQAEHDDKHQRWEDTSRELENVRSAHQELSTGMETLVRQEIDSALADRNAEVARLRSELESAREQVRTLQRQILEGKPEQSFLTVRDEDYFEGACQQLCQHVQQWVLRYSKFSDMRGCRLADEVGDDKIFERLDNAILDGSDVDTYLADRVKRRDVFMSIVMTMIWEFIFTRYLFGMDREQRQKLKSLEKILAEVGPASAVHNWRATTLTLLSRRPAFTTQLTTDAESVCAEILATLSSLLPPPPQLVPQILESLRKVVRFAADLSIEMRTQRAEFMMLPPLHPEYNAEGELARQVGFNASLMNERSGATASNEELEAQGAVVKLVLFPLVVKRGDDTGEGEEEIVVCPAQVLVARPEGEERPTNGSGKGKKTVRMASGEQVLMGGAMDVDDRSMRSGVSPAPSAGTGVGPTVQVDVGMGGMI